MPYPTYGHLKFLMEVFRKSFAVSDLNLKLIAITFSKSTYFWVGDYRNVCNDLHSSFPLKDFKDADSTATTLLGDLDSISVEIANTLAKIYKRGIFMSINVTELDPSLMSEFQEKLFGLIFDLFPRKQGRESEEEKTAE